MNNKMPPSNTRSPDARHASRDRPRSPSRHTARQRPGGSWRSWRSWRSWLKPLSALAAALATAALAASSRVEPAVGSNRQPQAGVARPEPAPSSALIAAPLTAPITAPLTVPLTAPMNAPLGSPILTPIAAPSKTTPGSALAVEVVRARPFNLPQSITATGSVAAWQEAIVGAEANGLRLARVLVSVGSRVKAGEVLAELDSATVKAELVQLYANVGEARAAAEEAAANAQRARQLQGTGAMSVQQILQFTTAERTARARWASLQAAAQVQELRLNHTRVRAPDDGIVSSRSATQGAVMAPGQELFRIIRQGRLEWRAEVSATDMARLKPGMPVSVSPSAGEAFNAVVREVAPTVDPATRSGLVYVDLPAAAAVRSGMFARGEFKLPGAAVMSLPQSAVLLRDGFAWVFAVGADSRVAMTKVQVGRRAGELVEITGGLAPDTAVVASGAGFLSDGDSVRLVRAVAAAVAAK